MERKYNSWVICGIDRCGKGTLINNIQQKLGFHTVLHYEKPKKLECYSGDLQLYQRKSFEYAFELLLQANFADDFDCPLIFDRLHLGEVVYGPLYRNYSGDYVFNIEHFYPADKFTKTKLILLTTSDFSFIQDDGESFDFSKKEQEQDIFKAAFEKSAFPNKQIIDVAENGAFKDPMKILEEALS